MSIKFFVILGLVMAVGCATSEPLPIVTASTNEPLPPVPANYACRARYRGADVLFLNCRTNPRIPNDTGTCDVQQVADNSILLTDSVLLELDCHNLDSPEDDAAIFTHNLHREILEASVELARLDLGE